MIASSKNSANSSTKWNIPQTFREILFPLLNGFIVNINTQKPLFNIQYELETVHVVEKNLGLGKQFTQFPTKQWNQNSQEWGPPSEPWLSAGGTWPWLLLSMLIAYVPDGLSLPIASARSISLVFWKEISIMEN